MTEFLKTNWERLLFRLLGLALFVFAFVQLAADNVTESIGIFLLAIFTFFYANISRFKRFKGLGFEAELWDDKKKEAEQLIEKLRGVVTIYTREVVLSKVMSGRSGGGSSWAERWDLYNELTTQHQNLGQKIDFSDLKSEIDSVFLFDACLPLSDAVRKAIDKAKAQASEQIRVKFGSPVTDLEGHNADHKNLWQIESKVDDLFARAKTYNVAQETLDVFEDSKSKLRENFEVELKVDNIILERLSKLATLFEHRPLNIDKNLIDWAEQKMTDQNL